MRKYRNTKMWSKCNSLQDVLPHPIQWKYHVEKSWNRFFSCLSNRKSLQDRNKESQEFYRSDSEDSNNDDKDSTSKCDQPETLQREETNVLPESTEAISLFVESTESSLTELESTELTGIAETPNEATMADVELVEAINVEDTVKATNVVDVSSVDANTEILNSKLKIFVIECRSPQRNSDEL